MSGKEYWEIPKRSVDSEGIDTSQSNEDVEIPEELEAELVNTLNSQGRQISLSPPPGFESFHGRQDQRDDICQPFTSEVSMDVDGYVGQTEPFQQGAPLLPGIMSEKVPSPCKKARDTFSVRNSQEEKNPCTSRSLPPNSYSSAFKVEKGSFPHTTGTSGIAVAENVQLSNGVLPSPESQREHSPFTENPKEKSSTLANDKESPETMITMLELGPKSGVSLLRRTEEIEEWFCDYERRIRQDKRKNMGTEKMQRRRQRYPEMDSFLTGYRPGESFGTKPSTTDYAKKQINLLLGKGIARKDHKSGGVYRNVSTNEGQTAANQTGRNLRGNEGKGFGTKVTTRSFLLRSEGRSRDWEELEKENDVYTFQEETVQGGVGGVIWMDSTPSTPDILKMSQAANIPVGDDGWEVATGISQTEDDLHQTMKNNKSEDREEFQTVAKGGKTIKAEPVTVPSFRNDSHTREMINTRTSKKGRAKAMEDFNAWNAAPGGANNLKTQTESEMDGFFAETMDCGGIGGRRGLRHQARKNSANDDAFSKHK